MPVGRGYCPECGRNVLGQRNEPSHLVHLLLSLVTVGVWLPVWFVVSVFPGGWICSICGGRLRRAGIVRGRLEIAFWGLLLAIVAVVAVLTTFAVLTVPP